MVAHSLGGLVAKKALCLSEQAADDHLRQLHLDTVAVAFLGTPHRGSGLAPYAKGVANVLKLTKRVNSDILDVLQRNSQVLADVEDSFATWLRKRGSSVDITCFFEELELPAFGMVRPLSAEAFRF